MAHVYAPKKFNPAMRYFQVELSDGKKVLGTTSYKEKLETPKELEALIDKQNEILELNEAALMKKEVPPSQYEQIKNKAIQERQRLKDRLVVRETLSYKGQSIKFLGYLTSDAAAAIG